MKKILLVVLVLLAIFSNSVNGAYQCPEKLRVGLYYSDNARGKVGVSCQAGLSLGYYQGNDFRSLMKYSGTDKLVVRKDTYFLASNSGVEESGQSSANLGPYHLRYYNNLSIEEAQTRVLELHSKNVDAFVACIGLTINVWGGNYISESIANDVKASSPIWCDVAPVSGKRVQVMRKDGTGSFRTLFLFGDNDLGLGIKAGIDDSDEGILKITTAAQTTYRGGLDFKRFDSGDMTITNVVLLEQYLYRVVDGEMDALWPMEALKAQAVCARCFAIRNLKKHMNKYGFSLCNNTDCQTYLGLNPENERCVRAVSDTRGEMLMYNGEPIVAYYSFLMGPMTEDAKNVWGNSVPYLVSVDNSFEDTEHAPNGVWSKTLTKKRATEILNNKGYNIGTVSSITALSYSPAGSVLKLEVKGTKGTKIFEKEKARTIFTDVPLSQMYTVVLKDDVFVFDGHGYGHGVGMSQFGAKKMAERAFGYKAILTHYYTGTYLERSIH